MLRLTSKVAILDEITRLENEYEKHCTGIHRNMEELIRNCDSAQLHRAEIWKSVHEYNALLEYVKSDKSSPRYKTLSPEAKKVVDNSYEGYKNALEDANKAAVRINQKIDEMALIRHNLYLKYSFHKENYESRISHLRMRLRGMEERGGVAPGPLPHGEIVVPTPTSPTAPITRQ